MKASYLATLEEKRAYSAFFIATKTLNRGTSEIIVLAADTTPLAMYVYPLSAQRTKC